MQSKPEKKGTLSQKVAFREQRTRSHLSPIGREYLLRQRFGTWEFPIVHVRAGTSAGLIIWEPTAPHQLKLYDELPRYLVGLPHNCTSEDIKQPYWPGAR
jgi:hypothetical protein